MHEQGKNRNCRRRDPPLHTLPEAQEGKRTGAHLQGECGGNGGAAVGQVLSFLLRQCGGDGQQRQQRRSVRIALPELRHVLATAADAKFLFFVIRDHSNLDCSTTRSGWADQI